MIHTRALFQRPRRAVAENRKKKQKKKKRGRKLEGVVEKATLALESYLPSFGGEGGCKAVHDWCEELKKKLLQTADTH